MKKISIPDFSRLMTVGEVARRAGVPVSTIHFYESKGLIVSTRNAGNQRRFASVVLRYIAIIKVAQRDPVGRDQDRPWPLPSREQTERRTMARIVQPLAQGSGRADYQT